MHDWFLHHHAAARMDAATARAEEQRALVAIGMDLRALLTRPVLHVAESSRRRLELRRADASRVLDATCCAPTARPA